MSHAVRDPLLWQFDMAWQLTWYHLESLTTEECLWRPAAQGLHVRPDAEGRWVADWPEREDYGLGPSSIAWLTWHFGFWWSMVLDHSFGAATLSREQVTWPGSAEGVREWIQRLHGEWRAALERLSDEELRSTERTRWPFQEQPFAHVLAWANVELTKSAAELGYARFLHAVRAG